MHSFCFLTADPKFVADARPWPTDVATLFWAFMGGALRGSPQRLGVSGGSRGMVAKFGGLHGGPQSSARVLAGDKTRMRVFFDRVEPTMEHAFRRLWLIPPSPLFQIAGSVSAKGPSMQLLPLYEEGKLQGSTVSYRPGSERPAALDGDRPTKHTTT